MTSFLKFHSRKIPGGKLVDSIYYCPSSSPPKAKLDGCQKLLFPGFKNKNILKSAFSVRVTNNTVEINALFMTRKKISNKRLN